MCTDVWLVMHGCLGAVIWGSRVRVALRESLCHVCKEVVAAAVLVDVVLFWLHVLLCCSCSCVVPSCMDVVQLIRFSLSQISSR